MRRTRLSLIYFASWSLAGGVGFLFAPQFTTNLLFSPMQTGDVIQHEDLMVRLAGVPFFALGMVVVQIARLRIEALYPTTLFLTVLILASSAGLYLVSCYPREMFRYPCDPMLLVLFGVVGLGFLLTLSAYLLDRRQALVG